MTSGEILLSLRYLPTAEKLTVSIIKAINLATTTTTTTAAAAAAIDFHDENKQRDHDGDGSDVAGDDAAVAEANVSMASLGNILLPDPYVKTSLMYNDRVIKRKKTATRISTLNPVFDESMTFDVPLECIDKVYLNIRVYSGKSCNHRLIGACAVGSNISSLARDHWKAMLQFPRKQVAKWYQLQIPSTSSCH
ncbi:hypothetical protein HELRODRAFT_162049 [Helobdella robusta]|uniref:C2 domain-containing protein n=1 Tax=Helobdella robusta TaxID=6412 RepID=T1ES68_HELRO|nr:hypothetical protein HELRODRAFT_162049 [Helobdella robusta]ESN98615.1 hypothetical protein HELRODRAFT_162049 [Helobdella robusta]